MSIFMLYLTPMIEKVLSVKTTIDNASTTAGCERGNMTVASPADHDVFLSRNWDGDYYVVTVRPPLDLEILRQLSEAATEFTGFGSWCIFLNENESRLTHHNDVEGDKGLRNVGSFLCDQISVLGYPASLVNPKIIPRTENGLYEAAA